MKRIIRLIKNIITIPISQWGRSEGLMAVVLVVFSSFTLFYVGLGLVNLIKYLKNRKRSDM